MKTNPRLRVPGAAQREAVRCRTGTHSFFVCASGSRFCSASLRASRLCCTAPGKREQDVQAMLNVDNISLYYGAAQALRGVSIAAEPGKVTCVLGRNGVGKTSLLRAMVGQYPIASGSITFEGADISHLRPYER